MKDISKNKNNKALFKVSQAGKILDSYIAFDLPTNNDQRFFNGPDQTINITPIKGNDTIYSIENSHFRSRFFVDFGKNSFTNLKNSTEKHFGGISNTIETTDYLYFNFSDNKNMYVGLYSKEKKKLKVDVLKFGNQYSLGLVIGSNGNNLISTVDSYIINMTLETIISNVNNKETKNKLHRLQGLDKENNPVLLVHKISEF